MDRKVTRVMAHRGYLRRSFLTALRHPELSLVFRSKAKSQITNHESVSDIHNHVIRDSTKSIKT